VASNTQFDSMAATWKQIDDNAIRVCQDTQNIAVSQNRPYSEEQCYRKFGVYDEKDQYQSVFMHEHTTPAVYWSQSLGFFFVLDLILTALLVGAFLVVRWVYRGFRPVKEAGLG
jgi:hypothetical protein